MHLDQPEGRDDKPHEQDWFWVFVHDELDSGNSRLKGIAPEFLRQMICFFTQGFGSTSEQLNIAAKGSSCMKSLRTAMAEWCTLTGLQVFDDQPPHIVETSRKRPRQEVQHTNTSAETPSLPTTVSTPGGPDQTNSLKPPQTIVKITQTQRINDLQEELQSMQNKYKELKSEHQALSAKNSSNEKAIQLVRQLARNVESAVPEILDGPGLGRRQTINQKSRASACAYVMIYRQIALSNVLNLRVRAPQWLLSQAEVAESREPANDHSLSEHMRTAANDIENPQ
ncbi:sigma-E controlled sporulation protein [Microdochium nivale]|nr:sigma-E controlled sporulation protein [Microdochium nivale]